MGKARTWHNHAVAKIVLFHSVLGLWPMELRAADRLRAAGHEIVTPDLYAGQLHVADADEFVPPAEVSAWLEATTRAGADAQVFTYQHAGHFFTDTGLPDHSAQATTVTWQRVLDFLRTVSG